MQINLKNIIALDKFASREATRYYLNGVYVHTVGGWVYAVATDGHRVVVHRFPNVDAVDWAFIIPSSYLGTVKFGAREDGLSDVTFDGRQIQFQHGGTRAQVPAVDGVFPDYQRVRPVDDGEISPAQFNGQYCADFDKLAKAFGSVAVITPRGPNPALVTFVGQDDLYGVLMPLRTDKRPFALRAPF